MLRAVVVCALVAVGCNARDDLFFTFDDRQVLCGLSLDDYKSDVDWGGLEYEISVAVEASWVLNRYAHEPGATVRIDTLERAFSMFAHAGLRFVTYADLDPLDPPYAGVAFAFDDAAIDAWFETRPLFDRYGAKVTFFVTRYADFSPEQRAKLHALAADGHAIEAHGVHHLDAAVYAAEHGAAAYLDDEVLPSLQILRDDGFTPSSFAYPFGARTEETDRAIAPHVRYLRTTPGPCTH